MSHPRMIADPEDSVRRPFVVRLREIPYGSAGGCGRLDFRRGALADVQSGRHHPLQADARPLRDGPGSTGGLAGLRRFHSYDGGARFAEKVGCGRRPRRARAAASGLVHVAPPRRRPGCLHAGDRPGIRASVGTSRDRDPRRLGNPRSDDRGHGTCYRLADHRLGRLGTSQRKATSVRGARRPGSFRPRTPHS